jgi:hypothetical protein
MLRKVSGPKRPEQILIPRRYELHGRELHETCPVIRKLYCSDQVHEDGAYNTYVDGGNKENNVKKLYTWEASKKV